jgi:hypothetical protein
MQNVPNIVRERLKAATPAANHPEADALTAFAERSLPERERGIVIEHLARCGDCRDTLALALPATETVATATEPHARPWLAWPTLRWGLAAAGIVAIASLGIVEYQRRPENIALKSAARYEVAAKEARNQPMAAPVSSGPLRNGDNIQAPPPSAITKSAGGTNASFKQKKDTVRAEAARTPVAEPQGGVGYGMAPALGGRLPHGPKFANQWQQQNLTPNQPSAAPSSPFSKQRAVGDLSANDQSANDLSANMRVPGVSGTSVSAAGQPAPLDAQAQNSQAAQMQAAQVQAVQIHEQVQPTSAEPLNHDYASARVGKAKPAETIQASQGVAPVSMMATSTMATSAAPQATGSPVSASSAPVPRWSINSTGGLQRSFDQGATWQAINVDANPAYFNGATSLRMSAAKVEKGIARKEIAPIFRAVAATDADVWAGGSAGVLYHSLDAGDHWTRVVPASTGTMLTGDIIRMEFSDAQHGKVSTSTAEMWTTSDDGQTWLKQ